MESNIEKKVGCVVAYMKGQNNYGTALQAYATIHKVGSLGYNYEIIKYVKKQSFKQLLPNLIDIIRSGAIKRSFYLQRKKIDLKFNGEYRRTKLIRTKAVDCFQKKYLDNKAVVYNGYDKLTEGSKKYSVVLVGSDQVWAPLSLYNKYYNLLFVDSRVPTFSYASSFGVSNIYPWQKDRVAEYLNKLTKIGVREQRGKEIVSELTGKDRAKVVLDPTLILDRSEWESLIDESRCRVDEPYILCYVLGEREDIRNHIKQLSRESGIKILNLPHIDNYHKMDDKLGNINLYDVDPLDFIKLIRDAQYVVTDSFHCSVFAAIFHKKFLTFYRKNPNLKGSTHSRIDSLFSTLGLDARLFRNKVYDEIQAEIDYDDVELRLKTLREDSVEFLKDSLSLKSYYDNSAK
ncbi:MAG: polysaccharide pyruvyl transferase family protein [Rikenellaceae bacterium]